MEMCAITAKFGYLDWQDVYHKEKPYELYLDVPDSAADLRRSNLVFKELQHAVHDVRGSEDKFTLNDNGFIYRRHKNKLNDVMLRDRESVEKEYTPEIEDLIRSEIDGVDEIFFFDWRVSSLRLYR